MKVITILIILVYVFCNESIQAESNLENQTTKFTTTEITTYKEIEKEEKHNFVIPIEIMDKLEISDLNIPEEDYQSLVNKKLSIEELNSEISRIITANYNARIMNRDDYNGVVDSMYQLYGSLTKKEKEFIILYPAIAYSIYNSSKKALAKAKELYKGDGLEDGNGDAFRHAYWNALSVKYLTFLNEVPSLNPVYEIEMMKLYGDSHESESDNELAKKMDLHNNQIGLDIIREYYNSNKKAPSDLELVELVQDALKNGKLWKIEDNEVVPTGSRKKVNTWYQENGSWYYFDENGLIVQNKWKWLNGHYYYFDKQGLMVTGWLMDNGKWYFLSSSGAMKTDWQKIDNKWYYLAKSGEMVTGWKEISGKWYYFNDEGSMLTGWKEISGKWYYFDNEGSMVMGWKEISGKWYYFNDEGSMVTRWKEISGYWYYFNDDGTMEIGWKQVGNYWYHFGANGVMQTDFQYLDGYWYFFNSNGVMKNGWVDVRGKTYYFDSNGIMLTGFQYLNGRTYQFDSSGALIKSFQNNPDKPSILPSSVILTEKEI